MGCLCSVFYLAVFLVAPFGIAAKAAAGEGGLRLRLFFKCLGAYFAGIAAAAGITAIIAYALPTRHGPPDQAVGQNMVLLFAVFPVLSLVLGGAGLCALIWRVENCPPKN